MFGCTEPNLRSVHCCFIIFMIRSIHYARVHVYTCHKAKTVNVLLDGCRGDRRALNSIVTAQYAPAYFWRDWRTVPYDSSPNHGRFCWELQSCPFHKRNRKRRSHKNIRTAKFMSGDGMCRLLPHAVDCLSFSSFVPVTRTRVCVSTFIYNLVSSSNSLLCFADT